MQKKFGISKFYFYICSEKWKNGYAEKFNLIKRKEMIEWTTIIVTLISSAIGAGAITSLVTMREKKKGKQLENKEKEEEVKEKNDSRWSKLCDELQDQIDKLNTRCDSKDERIMELEDQKSMLQQKLDEANTNFVKANLLKCSKLACVDRRPPLGFTELTPEEMLYERKKLMEEESE